MSGERVPWIITFCILYSVFRVLRILRFVFRVKRSAFCVPRILRFIGTFIKKYYHGKQLSLRHKA